MATISWTNEQRRDTAATVLGALISNTTLTTTAAIAETWAEESVSIANALLNQLSGVVVAANEESVVAALPPTTILRADGLE